MDSLKTRIVQVVCSDGWIREFPLVDVDSAAEAVRQRLLATPFTPTDPPATELADTLREITRAWRAACTGARAVWRGRRSAAVARDLVVHRLDGDEAAADALFTEALFVAR